MASVISKFRSSEKSGSPGKVKKANFMFRIATLEKLNGFIPNGERSKFVNQAVDEALIDFGRKIAAERMDKFRKEAHWHMTDAEIRKAREYGRE